MQSIGWVLPVSVSVQAPRYTDLDLSTLANGGLRGEQGVVHVK